MLFRRIINGKLEFSTDYTAERYTFAQYILQKVVTLPRKDMPFRGIIRRKLWFPQDNAEMHVFYGTIRGNACLLRHNPRKVTTFSRLFAQSSESPWIIHGKFLFFMNILAKPKQNSKKILRG
jgi:hypothetical protein